MLGDTDPEAEAVQIELLRRAGPTCRAALAMALSAQMIRAAKRAIRESMPGASQEELDLRFVELHYGEELASEMRSYFAVRRR